MFPTDDGAAAAQAPDVRPLADRMRPRRLEDFAGQDHLLGENRPLRQVLQGRNLHSLVLWGPPGTGKTTLARLVSGQWDAEFIALSAVMAGVKDIRAAVDTARAVRQQYGRRTVLFLDEVHRFNKAQQDAFLPFVEDGTVVFIGATTENPSFELNNALLSRARVYVLKSLGTDDLRGLLRRALEDTEHGLGGADLDIPDDQLDVLAEAADGDGRRALNLLELAADLATVEGGRLRLAPADLDELVAGAVRRFDKGGDAFYDQISALHKAVRGSDPDAALYWLARMLDGGCYPGYVARRLVRMASEDVGTADPRAVGVAVEAWQAWERLGSPEGDLALAQATVYLACTARSNAVYAAWNAAAEDARRGGSLPVPDRLRNAPTRLMKSLGHGKGYRYAHDEPDAYAAGETYFPDEMTPARYYRPGPRGAEQRIAEKLDRLRSRDHAARAQQAERGDDARDDAGQRADRDTGDEPAQKG